MKQYLGSGSQIILQFLCVILVFGAGCSAPEKPHDETATVMTYNLRYDTSSDGINQWDNRKEHVASLIRFYSPDFLGTQEGLVSQLEYLDNELPGYKRIGVGRDDGIEKGEFSAIHYNSDRFELVEGTEHTIWLSENPDIPGKSWDAAFPRVLTYGQFRSKGTGQKIYVFNTHFDHVGQTAREESAKIILQRIEQLSGDMPFILFGDFNVTEENPVYEILTTGKLSLRDAYYHSENPHVGPHFTFEGFEVKNATDARRIDYIFVSESIRVDHHAILSTFRDGYYPSDHLPVAAKVSF